MTRRIRHTHDDERRTHNNNQTPEILKNDVDPVIVDVSDSETEEGDGDGDRVEHFRKNTPRRSRRLQISRRSV